MPDLLGISVSGLRVAQTAISTTGHNISNAGVEGYSRQRTIQQTNSATLSGAGFVGNGVNTQTIERVVNQFAIQQVRTDTSLYHGLDLFHTNTSLLDNLLSDSSTGLASGLESFFASMQNGLDDPTSIPARQLILSEAENLADRFNTLHSRFQSIESGVNEALVSSVAQVNALVTNIANLNLKISDVSGSNSIQPNDLLDQRDEALRNLSEFVSIQVYEQGAGQLNVVVGSGQNLVVGTEGRPLSLVASAEDSAKLDIVFSDDSGGQPITSLLSGGEIGGLIDFRDNAMKDVYNEFGRVAVVMADTFNNMHQQGINLDNEFGGLFFNDVNDRLTSENRVIGNSNNPAPADRRMRLDIADSGKMTASDYNVTMEQGGLYRIERLNDGVEVSSGILSGFPTTVNFDGLDLVFEGGTFQGGDSFKLQPVKSGGRDFSSALINAKSLAFANPVLTDASITNSGSGAISAGEVLSLEDVNGNPLPLLANAGLMDPPLVVKFTTPINYDVLDNSDPGNPIQLDPPIRNQTFKAGVDNPIFGTAPGATSVSSSGSMIGLPFGRSPLSSAGIPAAALVANGYPSERITFTTASTAPGIPAASQSIATDRDQSAKDIANALSSVPGVSANAFTYMEVSLVNAPAGIFSAPLQVTLNGESLIEYVGAALAPTVPDPAAIPPDAFNDYLAERINQNSALTDAGVHAVSGTNPITGDSEIRVTSTVGDDLKLSVTAVAGTQVDVGDGENVTTALVIGALNTTSIAVGGKLDVTMDEGISLSTFPTTSLLFGDSTAADFAKSTYIGIQAMVNGVPEVGDTFTLDFNMDSASDNRNALALANLATAKTIGNGLASYSGGYGSLVEKIGIETSSARINRDASEQVLVQSVSRRDSVSGVNLDEEAANLIKFEQMYSANTQVISVARDLFDRLIGAF